jgi:hypothetical protein
MSSRKRTLTSFCRLAKWNYENRQVVFGSHDRAEAI